MTKMVRITRNFEYFDGVIDNGYQELELTKEEWDSMEEYEREERFEECSYIVGEKYPYDVHEFRVGDNEMEIEEFEK